MENDFLVDSVFVSKETFYLFTNLLFTLSFLHFWPKNSLMETYTKAITMLNILKESYSVLLILNKVHKGLGIN